MNEESPITELLIHWGNGDRQALDRLIPIVYAELRRQAARYMRFERSGHTLETADLIHEAYLRLIDQTNVQWKNRAHFYAISATLMRRILVDHARRQHRVKRGGSAVTVPLQEELLPAGKRWHTDLLELDLALTRLAAIDGRQSQIVELRCFSGLTIEDTAAVIGVSPTTVKDEWNLAKAWLRREIAGDRRRDA